MADELDRSEQATPKHRSEARSKGQVARSQEISSEVAIVVGLFCLAWIGPQLGQKLVALTHQSLSFIKMGRLEIGEMGSQIWSSVMPVFQSLGLWVFIMFLAMMVTGFAQVGFELSREALSLNWGRLNPLPGFKRLFSIQSFVRALLSILKVVIIIMACKGMVEKVTSADALNRAVNPSELVHYLLDASLALGWRVALILGFIAAADYGYQKWTHEKSLKMTKEEVKEEGKQAEANPQVKGKIRGLMRQRHRERMAKALKTATVVITNPTHVAIAMRYDRATMKAPKVVAKGLRLMAQRIKEEARLNGVPMIENKPLARSLYRHCQVGSEIPSAFYQAVAAVLAQVYRLAGKRSKMMVGPEFQ